MRGGASPEQYWLRAGLHTGLALSFTLWVLVSHGSTYWTVVCVLHDVSHLVHCIFIANIRNMAVVWTGVVY